MVWRLERQVVLGECRLEAVTVRMGDAWARPDWPAYLAARPVINAIPST
jgi:hypothetical protein